jgi:hypothetical protein
MLVEAKSLLGLSLSISHVNVRSDTEVKVIGYQRA